MHNCLKARTWRVDLFREDGSVLQTFDASSRYDAKQRRQRLEKRNGSDYVVVTNPAGVVVYDGSAQ